MNLVADLDFLHDLCKAGLVGQQMIIRNGSLVKSSKCFARRSLEIAGELAAGKTDVAIGTVARIITPDDADIHDIQMVIPFTVQIIPTCAGVMPADDQANEVIVIQGLHLVIDTASADFECGLLYLALYRFIQQHIVQFGRRWQYVTPPYRV